MMAMVVMMVMVVVMVTRIMEISTMSIRGRVVRELSAEQLSCGPRLQTEVPQKLSPIKFGHFPFLTFTAPHCQ